MKERVRVIELQLLLLLLLLLVNILGGCIAGVYLLVVVVQKLSVLVSFGACCQVLVLVVVHTNSYERMTCVNVVA